MSNQTLAVRHFAKDDLKPAEVLPGASMWAVSLDHKIGRASCRERV